MTQDTCFNTNFSDEHVEMLCRVAPFTKGHQHRFFPCLWTTGGTTCQSLIQGPDFPDHLRSHHGVTGPDRTQVICYWSGCFAEMKKESLMRHVNEIHLEVKYSCPNCSEQFTRPYTVQTHISKKHTGN